MDPQLSKSSRENFLTSDCFEIPTLRELKSVDEHYRRKVQDVSNKYKRQQRECKRMVSHVSSVDFMAVEHRPKHQRSINITKQLHSNVDNKQSQQSQLPQSPKLPMIDYDNPKLSTSKTLYQCRSVFLPN